MKIALVHDLLVKLGGAEKVLEKMLQMYPEADIFTLIYNEKNVSSVFPRNKIKGLPKSTQRIYKITGNQRFCLPYMSRGVESFDFSGYDIVIASNSAFVHGCITKPETKFIVYYHTPARYMWDRTNEYKKEIGWNKGIKRWILNKMLYTLRMWDYQASQRHDITLANSHNVKKRLKKYYGIDAQVIYPNVDIKRFQKKLDKSFSLPVKNYYIIISALTEFKKIDVSIKAFNAMPDKNLIIIGDGAYKKELEKMSKNNIFIVGPKYGDELVYFLQNSMGLIFSGEEDFGIVPIESFGAGKPVFAYKGGGLAETMVEGITGEFFLESDGKDFIEKFQEFDKKIKNNSYNATEIKSVSEKYSSEVFEKEMRKIVGF